MTVSLRKRQRNLHPNLRWLTPGLTCGAARLGVGASGFWRSGFWLARFRLDPGLGSGLIAITGLLVFPQAVRAETAVAQPFTAPIAPGLPGLGVADPFLPLPDQSAQIRLVIRLSERRVYVYSRDQLETSFPVAIGREGWETPVGSHQVIQMQHDPVWQHPFTRELVPPGRDNPLGVRWIGFWTNGAHAIGFHGTPNEETVGRPASHGCVRMYNQDVVKLFEMVRLGTPVEVVP